VPQESDYGMPKLLLMLVFILIVSCSSQDLPVIPATTSPQFGSVQPSPQNAVSTASANQVCYYDYHDNGMCEHGYTSHCGCTFADVSSPIFAIEGYVKYKDTDIYVSNANVVFESENGLYRYSATTTSGGYFLTKVPLTTYKVTVTHDGQCGSQPEFEGSFTMVAGQPNLRNIRTFFVGRECLL
jgi:hypothetical protein